VCVRGSTYGAAVATDWTSPWKLCQTAPVLDVACARVFSISKIIRIALLALLAALEGGLARAADDHDVASAIRRLLAQVEEQSPRSAETGREYQTLHALYASRDFSPLWGDGLAPSRQATELLQTLRTAGTYGLRPADYEEGLIPDSLSGSAPDDPGQTQGRARFDVALSATAVRFITHLHYGRVDPRAAGFDFDRTHSELDLGVLLEQLATTQDVGRVISSVEPQFFHYRLLKQTLGGYRALARDSTLWRLPALQQRSIKPGEPYAGAAQVRKLLHALGDLPEDALSTSTDLTLDPVLVAALQRFQERHGLTADGALGQATFMALTVPLAQRVRQIELTLERWRWLPAFTSPPIIVNIPQFRLFAFQSTQDRKAEILQMDVIVGRTYPGLHTPVFAADMKYVIFRPYWDVPSSIAQREMLPEIRANPDYLQKQHLEIVGGSDDSTAALPPTPENLRALASGALRLRQQPGADNALGLIKFMLPNAYNVYLHSTPAHRLFSESRRAFSHGCIRVSDPVALAAYVLRDAPGSWTPGAITAAMNGPTTLRVNLSKPIRVMILYGTALATEAGTILYFDDIYGHDRKLETLLHLPPAT
jgi:murein L,D-transpeptidase YcbB/YkuD